MTCRYQTWQEGGLWLGVISPTTKPHIPLIMWLCEFTWQMNFVISLLPQCLLLLNLTGWWLVMRSHHSKSSLVIWSCDHLKSRDESKTFYLQSHKLYGHQTWQGDNLWHEATTHKVTSTFKQVVKLGHVARLKPYSKRPMATKPDMSLGFDSFDKGKPTTGSHDFLIKWLLVTNSRDK